MIPPKYITCPCNSGLVARPADHDDAWGDWDEPVWDEGEEAGDHWEGDSSHPGMADEALTSQWGESYDWDGWEFEGKGSNLDGEPIDSDLDGEPMESNFDWGPGNSNSHGQTCNLTWNLGFGICTKNASGSVM